MWCSTLQPKVEKPAVAKQETAETEKTGASSR